MSTKCARGNTLRQLDRVIDLNLYPIATARASNLRWRPVGLGVMGLQDVFFKLRLAFDGIAARQLSTRIAETIYFHALHTSMELARECRAHDAFADTRAAQGELQFDAWGVTPSKEFRWDEMVDQIKAHGMRNSLLIAIAPTATIASIAGCYECIEPQLSNLGAFAYVYFLRSRGLLPGLAAGTNWAFRDESAHMAFAYEVINQVRREEPQLFDAEWAAQVQTMIEDAVDCESQFADDVLSGGVIGLTCSEMRQYLEYVADQRFKLLGLPICYHARNPFSLMELQDVQELTNFFERRVSAYQVAVQGEVAFDQAF